MSMSMADTTVNVYLQQSDQQLAAQAAAGSRDAFAALYKRYFQDIYDYAARVSRNQDVAADVVQSTFVKAWRQLEERKTPDNIKAWLFTVAHNAAIDELRYNNRLVSPTEDTGEMDQPYNYTLVDSSKLSNPQAVLEDQELVDLVWQSATALPPKDYSLLDLHVRQGLSPDELAENLGASKGAIYTKLSRLRDALGEAVVSSLLLRRGRKDCPDLNALLSELQATELTRKQLAIVTRRLFFHNKIACMGKPLVSKRDCDSFGVHVAVPKNIRCFKGVRDFARVQLPLIEFVRYKNTIDPYLFATESVVQRLVGGSRFAHTTCQSQSN